MNVAIAFGAGILSFLSPCVLPLVPAFLVNIAGEAALSGERRARTMTHALAFVLGFGALFTVVWIALALAGTQAAWLKPWVERAAGALLVLMGTHMLGLITIPFMAMRFDVPVPERSSGYPRSFLVGAAFGVGFTPCVGPYLGVILTLLFGSDLTAGAVLLAAYALGVGVPFLVIASGVGWARGLARWLGAHQRAVNAVGGVFVIAMGLLLLSGQFTRMAQLFNFLPLLG
ncbi:MAG TPA: cytochrome c biogenesis protein CcdA [Candidatus Limnocylindria bacterium]|nr:cytochrome c biogenesis protein CcdA [Candidatus Limnocylindria bacterium]